MKTIFSILLVASIFACRPEVDDNPAKLQNINISTKNVVTIPAQQFYRNVQFIPLEFKKESLIDIAEMLMYKNNRIYISSYVETSGSHDLVIFDEKGNFIERKYSGGEGPGSFSGVRDFLITEDGAIEVLDRHRRKIIRYNADGKYVENVYAKANISKMEKFNDGSYVFYRGNSYAYDDMIKLPDNLIYGDEEGNIKTNSYVPITDYLRDREIETGELFLRVPGKSAFYFNDALNDTIYFVDNKSIRPIFNLVLPDESYRRDKIKLIREAARQSPDKYNLILLDFLNDRKIINRVKLIVDMGHVLLLEFQRENIRYYAKVSKRDFKATVYKLDDSVIDKGFVFPYGEDKFVLVVESPLSFKNSILERPTLMDAFPPNMKSYIQNINTDVNPFLLVVDPRKLFSDE